VAVTPVGGFGLAPGTGQDPVTGRKAGEESFSGLPQTPKGSLKARATMLDVRAVSKSFGGVKALSQVSLRVDERQIVSLIGANGAGKTTLLSVVSGILQPDEGSVLFQGRRIDGLNPHQIARMGIARTFQNIRLFRGLSVRENIEVGLYHRSLGSLWDLVLAPRKDATEQRRIRERVEAVAVLLQIADYLDRDPFSLPYGVQRRVELARALVAEPRLLLLDEPVAGMTAEEAANIQEHIERLRASGCTIVLIEHNMRVVMSVSDWVVVLHHGVKLAEGTPEAIRADEKVIDAYLGGEA